MVKRQILLFLMALVLIFSVLPIFLTSGFKVSRGIVVPAKQEMVYQVLLDFRTWADWDYFQKLDKYAKWDVTSSRRSWQSNNKRVSRGEMSVKESSKNESITWKVVLPGDNLTWYPRVDLKKVDGGTSVSLQLQDDFTFFGRYRTLYYDFDMEIGNGFEQSLDSLKSYF